MIRKQKCKSERNSLRSVAEHCSYTLMNRANSATGKKKYVDEDIFAHVKGHVDDMMIILPNPVF